MECNNRVRIRGILTTTSPLHIGDGDTTTRSELIDTREGRTVEIPSVVTDFHHRAYITGKSIKGNLRSWLEDRLGENIISTVINSVFGSEDPNTQDAVGGKCEFRDAHAILPVEIPFPGPDWDATRLTAIRASVSIDRLARTAMPKGLFYREYVPAGVAFEVTITGQDIVESDELVLLLTALEGFNCWRDSGTQPVTIGANTGDGWGRFTWQFKDIARMDTDDVSVWLADKNKPIGYAALKPIPQNEIDALVRQAKTIVNQELHPRIIISGNIHFENLFLVNDPSRARKNKGDSKQDIPDQSPVLDSKGQAYLPSSSLRGALRSQAERIVRTINPDAACLSTDSNKACSTIYAEREKDKLCPVCRAFGAAGWRSPINFSDFHVQDGVSGRSFQQEFVAIDRFTGGAADTAKFNTLATYQPVLEGSISIDLKRAEPWMLGLLALTLRDFMEGDMTLGFGAAKGYGTGRLEITGMEITGSHQSPEYVNILEQHTLTERDVNNINFKTMPDTEIQTILTDMVRACQDIIMNYKNQSAKGESNG